jgi:hypothetical protein
MVSVTRKRSFSKLARSHKSDQPRDPDPIQYRLPTTEAGMPGTSVRGSVWVALPSVALSANGVGRGLEVRERFAGWKPSEMSRDLEKSQVNLTRLDPLEDQPLSSLWI